MSASRLEDLISHYEHGNELADEIVALAQQNEVFKDGLSGVWLSPGKLRPEAEAKLAPFVHMLTPREIAAD